MMRADGSAVRRERHHRGGGLRPGLVEGGRLAFIRQREAKKGRGYVHEIVSVDRTGRDQRVLLPASRYAYGSLAWSPDGRRLAYTVPYTDPGSPFVVGLFVLGPMAPGPDSSCARRAWARLLVAGRVDRRPRSVRPRCRAVRPVPAFHDPALRPPDRPVDPPSLATHSTANRDGRRTASRSCSHAPNRGALRSTRSGPTGAESD